MHCNPFQRVWSVASKPRASIVAGLVATWLICGQAAPVTAADVAGPDPTPVPEIPYTPEPPALLPPETDFSDSLRATTIRPYRSADLASEVSGVIEAIHFQEGDLIQSGQVVVEISTKRYTLLAEKAQEALKGMVLALERAEQNVTVLKDLLTQDATTRQDLLKAETERDVTQTRLKEARKDFELAQLNLQWCRVKAPFTGYLGDRYKEQFESVERLEKLFSLVDSSKVYALANVAERLVPKFKKGTSATFVDPSGKIHSGIVEKVGKLIDPKSKTRKVWVLIDNSKGSLEIGMTGTLMPESPEPGA
jgi:RND family efflux transporter MFP subunit